MLSVFMLSIVMLNVTHNPFLPIVVTLSVVMLNAIMLSVVMLYAIMLSVVEPLKYH
jgi:hypothetical protein